MAWRRTALTVAIGSLAAARFLPAAFGSAVWALVGFFGMCAALSLWTLSRGRAVLVRARLEAEGDRAGLPGGELIVATAAGAAALGVTALAILIVLRGP